MTEEVKLEKCSFTFSQKGNGNGTTDDIEDLTIEHSPGQFTGLITLALSKSDAQVLSAHLIGSGWNVHAPR
jgi:hypothetical protein